MKRILHTFGLAALSTLLLQCQTSPRPQWTYLTTQPDRQQLFASHVRPVGLEMLPLKFAFPADARFDTGLGKKREGALFGIDISHHDEGKMNFAALTGSDVYFLYAKASQGVGYVDPKFKGYTAALKAVPAAQRPLWGAYHFISAAGDGALQADHFLAVLKDAGAQNASLPTCVDLEWDIKTADGPDQWRTMTADQILQTVRRCVDRIKQRTGRAPMIYTARAWWEDRHIPLSKLSLFSDCPLWIADYQKSSRDLEKPRTFSGKAFALWQFTEKAVLPPATYKGAMDANIFYGSAADFKRTLGLP